jgi:hypothetical protein
MNFGEELRKITDENTIKETGNEIIDQIKQQCYLNAKQGKDSYTFFYGDNYTPSWSEVFYEHDKYIKLFMDDGLKAEIHFGDYRNRSSYPQDDWSFTIRW